MFAACLQPLQTSIYAHSIRIKSERESRVERVGRGEKKRFLRKGALGRCKHCKQPH
jgi:hypothetical protein